MTRDVPAAHIMEGIMIRVLITDDFRVWRAGVRTLLEKEPDIAVVGEAGDGQEAIELAHSLAPDVILMDIKMPRLDGLKATEQICKLHPQSRVIMLAMSWDEPLVHRAVQNGARGYLPKDIEPEQIVAAVHAVFADKTYFDPRISPWIVGDHPSRR